ncbi:MAG: phosphonate C-P lyase system protein PhnG [Acidiphilium sp.]|nr:phosphonate C-P lyase system protein PhnG [Acidiphilium sp.]MDD4936472.1 phosphonate C-P lyase system protein PhnG [Acidiphilium sp.]
MLDDLSGRAPKTIAARQAWLGVLARASLEEMRSNLADAPDLPDYTILRGPETGMAMARGRIGGGGAAFNLGEMTITRCSIRDATGRVGHGYAAGRDDAKVELIARLDAVLQNAATFAAFHAAIIVPLAKTRADRWAAIEAQAAQTNVNFFTLATMRT